MICNPLRSMTFAPQIDKVSPIFPQIVSVSRCKTIFWPSARDCLTFWKVLHLSNQVLSAGRSRLHYRRAQAKRYQHLQCLSLTIAQKADLTRSYKLGSRRDRPRAADWYSWSIAPWMSPASLVEQTSFRCVDSERVDRNWWQSPGIPRSSNIAIAWLSEDYIFQRGYWSILGLRKLINARVERPW